MVIIVLSVMIIMDFLKTKFTKSDVYICVLLLFTNVLIYFASIFIEHFSYALIDTLWIGFVALIILAFVGFITERWLPKIYLNFITFGWIIVIVLSLAFGKIYLLFFTLFFYAFIYAQGRIIKLAVEKFSLSRQFLLIFSLASLLLIPVVTSGQFTFWIILIETALSYLASYSDKKFPTSGPTGGITSSAILGACFVSCGAVFIYLLSNDLSSQFVILFGYVFVFAGTTAILGAIENMIKKLN